MSGVNKANQRQNKKHGAIYQNYRNSKRRELNKLRRVMRVIKKQPLNNQLLKCIEEMSFETPLHAKRLNVEKFLKEIHALRIALTNTKQKEQQINDVN